MPLLETLPRLRMAEAAPPAAAVCGELQLEETSRRNHVPDSAEASAVGGVLRFLQTEKPGTLPPAP